MAAPSPTPRVTPNGIPLRNGFRTLVTLSLDTNINFWEREVTPGGIDNGDPIDTTTMHTVRHRTKAPRDLVESTDIEISAAYDPVTYSECLAACGAEGTITVTFRDGSTRAVYGYLKSFIPEACSEGEMPMAAVTFVVTNWDPANDVEAGQAVSAVAGS